MATDVPVVRVEDALEYAKQLVANSRYRTACVVREDGTLAGMISRNSLLEEVQKAVILLDHNEYAQAVDGIEKAEILEIIDHHRLGAISTLKPVRFLNEPVGSTSTIVDRDVHGGGDHPVAADGRAPPLRHPLGHPRAEDVDDHLEGPATRSSTSPGSRASTRSRSGRP